MSIRKHFAQAALVVAVAGFTAGPAAAQAPPTTPPPTPGTTPPPPEGMPPSAPMPAAKSCKGKKAKAKPRCRKHRPRAQLLATASAAAPRYRLGATDCHRVPFVGSDTMQPLVTAADGDPGVDHQFARVETFRYRWNGRIWAYENTIDSSWAFATERAWSSDYYTADRWQGRGTYGAAAAAGYYRTAQRITWHPTKSAPQQYSVFLWTPHVQDGRAVDYCTF